MENFEKFTEQEEAEYLEWLQKNFKFIRRFIKECIDVNANMESDYYGSEWVETSVDVIPPHQLEH